MRISNPTRTHDQLTGVVAGQHQAEAVAATQAAMEAETAQQTFARPDRVRFPPGVAKVWVSWLNAVVRASYNVTSVTDTATGDWTVNITDAFSSVQWCSIVGLEFNGAPSATNAAVARVRNKDASSCRVQVGDVTDHALRDPNEVFLAGFGDQ